MQFETIAAQAAHQIDGATGAVAPPIYLSTTFERDADGEYSRGFVYSRSDNPNRRALEQCLAMLEGGEAGNAQAAAFASGSAATAAVFQALAPGDHVIAPDDCYHGTARMLREVFAPLGSRKRAFVDMTDADAVQRAVRPNTRLVWVETPSNPLLKITDIDRMADIAHSAGALCAGDNTWASPMLQRPFDAGGRPGGALHYQVPQRPRGHDRRRGGQLRGLRHLPAGTADPESLRGGALAIRLLAHAARHPHAAGTDAAALRQRRTVGPLSTGSS